MFTFTNFCVILFAFFAWNQISEHSSNSRSPIASEAELESASARISPLWERGQRFSIMLYFSTERNFAPDLVRSGEVFYRRGLVFDNPGTLHEFFFVVKERPPECSLQCVASQTQAQDVAVLASSAVWATLHANGSSVFLHVLILREGAAEENEETSSPAEGDASYKEDDMRAINSYDIASGAALHHSTQFVSHHTIPTSRKRRYLLADVERHIPGRSLRAYLVRPMKPMDALLSAYPANTTISFWKPETTLQIAADWTVWPSSRTASPASPASQASSSSSNLNGRIPSAVLRNIVAERDQGEQQQQQQPAALSKYTPALAWHDRPLSFDDYVPLIQPQPQSQSQPQPQDSLPVKVHLRFTSLSDFSLMETIRETTVTMRKEREKEKENGNFGSASQQASFEDAVSELLSGTSVNMVILACVASGLHMLFELLAFHSDVEFWMATTTTAGLSVRSVNIELISQIIVFLYLWDSLASLLIITPAGLGILLQTWKLWRVLQIQESAKKQQVPPSITGLTLTPVSDCAAAQTFQEMTVAADNVSTQILTACLLPLVGFYSLWSLVVHTHGGWYAWLIATMTACTYAFGFVSMCPQLYINYKLQSVSHLPWKFLVYRFLSTVIDDVFAFVLKTPLMHRVSVFRDDVIFVCYLWQRWTYKVDSTRPPER